MANDLKQFRHGISLLKKQGLLPARVDSGIKLDARNALPTMKVKGKSLSALVKKYDDIVSGKATAIKTTAKERRRFQRAGFETTQKHIIVPHAATERASLRKGEVHIKSRSGIERVQIPVEFQNLKQYFRDIKKKSKEINKLKGKREYFGIRFFGGQRANFYADIRDLIEDLEHYESIQTHIGYKQEEIYKHIEILRMDTRGTRTVEKTLEQRRVLRDREYNRKHAKKQRAKIKKNPSRKRVYDAAAAKRAAAYRKRRKKNKRAAAHDRRMNRERQARFKAKQRKTKAARKKKRK